MGSGTAAVPTHGESAWLEIHHSQGAQSVAITRDLQIDRGSYGEAREVWVSTGAAVHVHAAASKLGEVGTAKQRLCYYAAQAPASQ